MTAESVAPVPTLSRRAVAEMVGTAFLVASVVGSGVMAEQLAGGSVALALLANAAATGAMLVALVATFGELSGAHFNPLVTLLELVRRRTSGRAAAAYVAAQLVGGALGVVGAHAMFGLPLVAASHHARAGAPQLLSELVATSGLILVVGLVGGKPSAPFVVGGYVVAGYWFTASTCFANPVVTLARSASDTFSGIRPIDVGPFLAAQVVGAAVAAMLVAWLGTRRRDEPAGAAASRPA
jgi:glycerol uptake facilitator-like aquaporin